MKYLDHILCQQVLYNLLITLNLVESFKSNYYNTYVYVAVAVRGGIISVADGIHISITMTAHLKVATTKPMNIKMQLHPKFATHTHTQKKDFFCKFIATHKTLSYRSTTLSKIK